MDLKIIGMVWCTVREKGSGTDVFFSSHGGKSSIPLAMENFLGCYFISYHFNSTFLKQKVTMHISKIKMSTFS